MKRILVIVALTLVASASLLSIPTQAQTAQEKEAARNATREKLRQLLDTAGQRKDVNVTFRQATKQPYNFVGSMGTGLTQADTLEIVVSVTPNETIGFRIYPHFKGDYINVDKVKNSAGLMRKLLYFSDRNFLYWGADETGDIFSGYTFTLESGFPYEAMVIVLRSIRNTDGFVGELRPFIDGSPAPASSN
jgi:hypothetical protein